MSASSHFSTDGGTPTVPGRFVDVAAIPAVEFVPGLEFRPVLGSRTMTNFVRFAPHTEAPLHVHEEEQIVLVLEGEFDFEIDGEVKTMRVGDVAVVPPWVPHGARTRDEPCYEVDVFNPPRSTLLEHAQAVLGGTVLSGGTGAGADTGASGAVGGKGHDVGELPGAAGEGQG